VVGPSHVGKTSIINRLVNNTFYPDYLPTTSVHKYWLTYSIESDFKSIEIVDTFPHDHPLLYTDEGEKAYQMQSVLNKIVQNLYYEGQQFHAFIFVYDASDRQSFLKLKKMYMTVKEIEKSARRGK
jgi:GTPase SAR1 family protein